MAANDTASTNCSHIREMLDEPCNGLLRVRCPERMIAEAGRRANSAGISLGEYARRAVVAALVADAIRRRAAAVRAVPTHTLFLGD